MKSLSCVLLFVTPWTVAYQTPPSMGFSRQEYWSGLPLPSPPAYAGSHKELDTTERLNNNTSLCLQIKVVLGLGISWPWTKEHGKRSSKTTHKKYDWVERHSGEGNGIPLQYSCLENPMDGGVWWATVHGVRHDWATSLSLFTFLHWRRKWQPTPVFLPGESQGWGSLACCSSWGCKELDMTEQLNWTQ